MKYTFTSSCHGKDWPMSPKPFSSPVPRLELAYVSQPPLQSGVQKLRRSHWNRTETSGQASMETWKESFLLTLTTLPGIIKRVSTKCMLCLHPLPLGTSSLQCTLLMKQGRQAGSLSPTNRKGPGAPGPCLCIGRYSWGHESAGPSLLSP